MKFINLNSTVISMLPIAEKREIYAGTYNHLVIMSWDFEVINKIEIGSPVRAIAADKKGNIFFGLSTVFGETLFRINQHRDIEPISFNGQSFNILSLCVDKDDNLWIGTLGSGLLKYDGVRLDVYNFKNSDVNDNTIFSLCPEPTNTGKVWFGCQVNGFGLTDTKDEYEDKYTLSPMMLQMMLPEYCWKRYIVKTQHTPGSPYLNCKIFDKQILSEDYDDSYNNDHQKKSMRAKDNFNMEMQIGPKEQIEFSGYIKCLEKDSDNALWIGTINSGLIKMPKRNDIIVYHTDNSDIPDNDIYALAVEVNGIVWAGTDNGLFRIENEKLKIFNTNNSAVKCNEIRSLCILNDHLLVGYNHSSSNSFGNQLESNAKSGGISVFKISELE